MLRSVSRLAFSFQGAEVSNPLSQGIAQTKYIPTRCFSVTTPATSNLDQFRDSVSREKRFTEVVGRNWSVEELRRKSFEDLHKLWYVLYKERNMLLTESHLSRVNNVIFPQKERQQKVKKSMAAIKVVLGERKRNKIAQHALKMAMLEESKAELAEESISEDNEEEIDIEKK